MELLNLKEQAYYKIKEDLLNCTYLPGASLNEKDLIRALEVGRTPLREALLQLENEGYITIIPRKNILVNPITYRTIHNLYQVRRMIDPQVAIEFKSSLDTEVLMGLLKEFKSLSQNNSNAQDFYRLDLRFHMHLVECTRNDLLIDYYQQLMDLQYQIGMYTYMIGVHNDFSLTIKEHEIIIESLILGKDETIKQAIIEHINSSMLSALHAIDLKK